MNLKKAKKRLCIFEYTASFLFRFYEIYFGNPKIVVDCHVSRQDFGKQDEN